MIEIIHLYEGDKGYEQIRFSNPPAPECHGEFKIIQRPEIPELKDFVERYFQPDSSIS